MERMVPVVVSRFGYRSRPAAAAQCVVLSRSTKDRDRVGHFLWISLSVCSEGENHGNRTQGVWSPPDHRYRRHERCSVNQPNASAAIEGMKSWYSRAGPGRCRCRLVGLDGCRQLVNERLLRVVRLLVAILLDGVRIAFQIQLGIGELRLVLRFLATVCSSAVRNGSGSIWATVAVHVRSLPRRLSLIRRRREHER